MKNCQVLDDRYILRESDIAAADNQGKEVYFLLNLGGSLPFSGTLESLGLNRNVSESWSLAFSTDNLLEVKPNNKVTTLPFLPKQWKVIFRLLPIDVRDWWISVLHMTTGEDNCCYGSQTPAIFVKSSVGLTVHSAISGQKKEGVLFPSPYPTVGVYTTIEITQEINEEGRMMFRVVIDGVEVHDVENTDPRVFENVVVYVANPWQHTYPKWDPNGNDPNFSIGYIKDLSIYVKNEPEKISHGMV